MRARLEYQEHPISKGEVLGDDGSGVVALAIWYFGMYGPASMNDFVWWRYADD